MRACRGRTRRPATVAGVMVLLLALGACGSDRVGLAAGPTAELHDRVGAVRASAAVGDAEAAQAALEAFRAEVHRLVASGQLDPAEAVELLAQADRVAAGLDAQLVPADVREPAPEPTPRPASRTTRAPQRAELSEALAALIRDRMREHARDDRRHGKDHEKDGKGDRHDGRH